MLNELEKKARRLTQQYPSDLNDEDLAEEMQHLQAFAQGQFSENQS